MGNMSSCVHPPQSEVAELVDLRRKTLRCVGVPVAAADLMLEDPGHVISPLNGFRLSAMKADDSLVGGRVYVLIPVSRANGKLSASEMAYVESVCGKRRSNSKRRSSRVLPDISGDCGDDRLTSPAERGDIIGIANRYRARQWKPALAPICEGI